ncbi:MAG: pyridoxamine 5'-phosphate oxidase family protein [candidate division WOR-3 bacterium]|nr:pyridoxamine 5'-phosphate oxidase family protein [candidate division WOR-3 bacterium]
MSLNAKERIVAIMKETLNHAYLATTDKDQPIIRSMTPIVEDDMTIWLITYSNSRKIKQIKKNPKVCLFFTKQPDGDKTVCVLGKAQIVTDLKTKRYVWQISHYDPSSYFPRGPEHSPFCVLKVIPTKIEWWDNWEMGRRVYRRKL